MAQSTQSFVGLEAYARSGERIGKVENVILDPASDEADCLVIEYGRCRDLVVPVDAVARKGDRVTVPVTYSFLDGAPRDATHGASPSVDKDETGAPASPGREPDA